MSNKNRKVYVLGNWKLNKTFNDLATFFETFNNGLKMDPEIDQTKQLVYGIAPSYISIQPVCTLKTTETMVLAQDICGMGQGAYTAQISCPQLLDYKVNASLIGHSETRMYLSVNDSKVNIKAKELLKYKMTPVICIGESIIIYEKNQTKEFLADQLKSTFEGISKEDVLNCVIAYEPLWAIGSGKTPSIEEIQKICAYIRSVLANIYAPEIADKISILYGGSANEKNCLDIIMDNDVDGLLIGGASLDPNKFLKIIGTVKTWLLKK